MATSTTTKVVVGVLAFVGISAAVLVALAMMGALALPFVATMAILNFADYKAHEKIATGPIRSFKSPSGWTYDGLEEDKGTYVATWNPSRETADNVSLTIRDRGPLEQESDGQALRAVLEGKDHKLSDAELQSVQGAMRSTIKGEETAETLSINGVRVLLVRRQFKDADAGTTRISKTIYVMRPEEIDRGDEGEDIQEVAYCALDERYEKYAKTAGATMDSLEIK